MGMRESAVSHAAVLSMTGVISTIVSRGDVV